MIVTKIIKCLKRLEKLPDVSTFIEYLKLYEPSVFEQFEKNRELLTPILNNYVQTVFVSNSHSLQCSHVMVGKLMRLNNKNMVFFICRILSIAVNRIVE